MNSIDERLGSSIRSSRVLAVYALVVVWSLALVARLAYLQIWEHPRYAEAARQQQHGFSIVRGKRGEILDRNLEELAISIQLYGLAADPELIEDREGTARALSPLLSVPAEEILARLSMEGRFVWLARKLAPREADELRELGLPGVFLRRENSRFYSGGAAQVLGFVGREGKGLAGLEYRLEDELRGEQKRVSLKVDARRKSYAREAVPDIRRGKTLVLTLDKSIQYAAEETLERTVRDSGARDGSIVLLDPHSGEVLAMASYPGFDANHFQEYDEENYRNRPILQLFEPGSTAKIVSLAAVLEEGAVDLEEQIDCRVGTLRLAGKVYREATRSFDQLTFHEILAKSSNVGTIKLALRLGPDRLHHYLERFGFGRPTDVDLPGEEDGLLRPVSQWSRISIGALAIGQELAVTPLQVVRAVAAIANGGYLVRPYVVRQVLSPGGDLLQESAPQLERILSETTALEMKHALARVVTEGTGGAAALRGYSSAGKTGTAQKFVDGRYSDSLYVASYVGFAPLEEPRLAAIVVINEPQGRYYGGHVAGPAFKEVMERALLALRVPPDQPEPPVPPAPRVAELAPPASVSVGDEPLAAEALEETVLTLIDQDRQPSPVLQLETGLVAVPDFTGKSLRDVVRECGSRGLQLKVSGSGLAVGQRPLPGRRVRRGAICEVFFSNRGRVEAERTDRQGAAAASVAGGQ